MGTQMVDWTMGNQRGSGQSQKYLEWHLLMGEPEEFQLEFNADEITFNYGVSPVDMVESMLDGYHNIRWYAFHLIRSHGVDVASPPQSSLFPIHSSHPNFHFTLY